MNRAAFVITAQFRVEVRVWGRRETVPPPERGGIVDGGERQVREPLRLGIGNQPAHHRVRGAAAARRRQ